MTLHSSDLDLLDSWAPVDLTSSLAIDPYTPRTLLLIIGEGLTNAGLLDVLPTSHPL